MAATALTVIFVAALGGVFVGGLLVGLVVGFSYAGRLQHERRQRAQAEEKNLDLERQLSQAQAELPALRERVEASERALSERQGELFDKTTRLAELTVQVSNVRAQLAGKEGELDEVRRTAAARLAEQKRLACQRLERIHDAQMQMWDDFSHLIAEAMAEEQPEYPRLVVTRNRTEPDEDLSEEEEEEAVAESEEPAAEIGAASARIADANAESTAEETTEEGQDEDPLAGIDLDTVTPNEDTEHPKPAGDSASDYLDDQASEQTASLRFQRPDASDKPASTEPETIEVTLFDEDELDAAVGMGDQENQAETLKLQAGEVDAPVGEPTEEAAAEPFDSPEKKSHLRSLRTQPFGHRPWQGGQFSIRGLFFRGRARGGRRLHGRRRGGGHK
jgi:hypothetical protein